MATSHLASGKLLYVAPTGSDSAAGTIAAPYATFSKAITAAVAGDTIYARGGVFNINAQLGITKSGTASAGLSLLAYPGETPILDFAAEPSGKRGIQLDANYWTMRGLTVRNARDNGVFISGSNNVIDRFDLYGNQDSGLQIAAGGTRVPSNNLILNTDSHGNYDPANNGENADGFAAKFRGLGPGNVFRGVRAWGNSDDGFDFWARNRASPSRTAGRSRTASTPSATPTGKATATASSSATTAARTCLRTWSCGATA
ncbi:MAG: right-handed parallel beta-helix repeat-containing protein [Tepidisphaeraceae bacterium]